MFSWVKVERQEEENDGAVDHHHHHEHQQNLNNPNAMLLGEIFPAADEVPADENEGQGEENEGQVEGIEGQGEGNEGQGEGNEGQGEGNGNQGFANVGANNMDLDLAGGEGAQEADEGEQVAIDEHQDVDPNGFESPVAGQGIPMVQPDAPRRNRVAGARNGRPPRVPTNLPARNGVRRVLDFNNVGADEPAADDNDENAVPPIITPEKKDLRRHRDFKYDDGNSGAGSSGLTS